MTNDPTKRDTHIAVGVDQLPDLSAEIAAISRGAMQRRIAELEAALGEALELVDSAYAGPSTAWYRHASAFLNAHQAELVKFQRAKIEVTK